MDENEKQFKAYVELYQRFEGLVLQLCFVTLAPGPKMA
jgi:hypothetical protein